MADVVDIDPEIRGESQPGDRRLAELATRQHGVVSRGQLHALGLGRSAIDHRVAAGRLHPLYPGVYAVGHRAVARRGRWMAAVLSCGPGAVLSHQSAAALWDLRRTTRSAVDVTAPVRGRRRRPGIVLHQVRRLHPDDHRYREGIPVTTVARTLLDLAETVPRAALERAWEQAERLHLLDIRDAEEACKRSPGRRGLKCLGRLLLEAREAPATRSELERGFLDLCREAGLPPPRVNVVVAGLEVDMAWPAHRLVVELDGHAYHGTRDAFERDRVRDAALQLAGQRVLRITHRRMRDDREAIVHAVRSLVN
jgi:very-short-patch-repair endonuclease